MRICFPVENDQGLESMVCEHFGHVPAYLLVDADSMEVVTIDNTVMGQQPGSCAPVGLLSAQGVDVLVVGGIGRGAIARFMQNGTKIYRAVPGTIRQNVEMLKTGRLEEFLPEWTCAGHGHHEGGGCGGHGG
jgi:ArsR family transcriptional regulator